MEQNPPQGRNGEGPDGNDQAELPQKPQGGPTKFPPSRGARGKPPSAGARRPRADVGEHGYVHSGGFAERRDRPGECSVSEWSE